MEQRFVILEHSVNGAAHFDLMLELDGNATLRTWQLAKWPLAAGESCPARRLDDHRRDYLSYEGEVSGGRGVVRRVASGVWSGELRLTDEDGTVIQLTISNGRAERTT